VSIEPGVPTRTEPTPLDSWQQAIIRAHQEKDEALLVPLTTLEMDPNQEVHKLLKDGINVAYQTSDDNEAFETVNAKCNGNRTAVRVVVRQN
jgi:hypothetical protein